VPPKLDFSEAPQTAERHATQSDSMARVPALAIGYRMPPRASHEAVVGAVVGELLHNGQASRLYQALVKEKEVAIDVSGGVNWPLGNPFEYDGPTLMTSLIFYPPTVKEDALLGAYDAVIADLAAV
jgi:zinc protease